MVGPTNSRWQNQLMARTRKDQSASQTSLLRYMFNSTKPDKMQDSFFPDVLEQLSQDRAHDGVGLRFFGVTEDGHSVLVYVTGFFPYFYVAVPRGFDESDIDAFADQLNVCIMDTYKKQAQGNFVKQIEIVSLWGYRGDDWVVGMNWIEIPAGQYKPVSDKDKKSKSSLKSGETPSPRTHRKKTSKSLHLFVYRVSILSVLDGRAFPPRHRLIQFQGKTKLFTRLNKCSHIVGSQVTFDDEAEMLQAWRDFVEGVDLNLVIGDNIANFDFPYLMDRAKHLKANKLPFLGRMKGRMDSTIPELEGRLQLNVLQSMQCEHELLSYTLNSLCAQLLVCISPSAADGQAHLFSKANEGGKVIPVLKGLNSNEQYEGATVVKPKKGYYDTPIATLDFSSLYPSIMMVHNLCYTTLLEKSIIDRLQLVRDVDDIRTSNNDFFATTAKRKGLLPTVLEDLMSACELTKADLKKEADPSQRAILDGHQLALKISVNSVYEFTGATIGKLPCLPISSSVTAYGRQMIEKTKQASRSPPEVEAEFSINNGHAYNAEVIYGETDSVMVKFGPAEL
ncbi:DNA polymerase family B-domain-containing protein [Suillus bovinus]|uniref:DNA polymerase family B-domain-containing protein n=1 Tax=Suillus bovinus TaxID=48563 RepID=UPI001B876B8A|nr:DNA polymerase family B-domain-containing protein [Suillus bovinus]KAG2148198.1 DNA polymerase family B-domain-containing protein [Suillus bovinus]